VRHALEDLIVAATPRSPVASRWSGSTRRAGRANRRSDSMCTTPVDRERPVRADGIMRA
jgi:hypothetical protein